MLTETNKHTPGPWYLATGNSWKRILSGYLGQGVKNVCIPYNNQADGHPDLILSDSNAALICAAPDLLNVCELMLKEIIAERDCLYDSHANPDGEVTDDEGKQGLAELDAIIDQAQAVIQKATGDLA